MKKFLILIISLFLISCSSTGIYKVTVTQGTVLKQEDVNKLEVGMNKDQVIFILGNPTFENFFEPNVWNYFYQVTRGNDTLSESKLKIIFDADNLLEEIIVIKLDD
ncbi:MAG: outer membrane protein assembly factor BamE [Gammaproteobacteria bacterium]|uniref:Outer membrane protein assembly factor BamE n=1 Tax=SAR86 cluster bacterium TaxID=2030880 RepID=A0A520MY36_9GAMM|nr:outer membrane assembly protein BamE [Gammaproteobacteria bacterium]MBA4730275.1 outer membrane protein assembly factor BamE [SAR86 cluster bacterium]RPG35508.1 MAG: outer membrane protein assembly factor BamE [Gammaproteobacteria bacterium TMED193]RZO26150.1 MAG: outer membrane protein assembly factor BamE [SAR86 cluster bacterium]|tara:strand:- start:404 stop:721 length:318 start_codon:yes stop_codon:yes gene_type:complete